MNKGEGTEGVDSADEVERKVERAGVLGARALDLFVVEMATHSLQYLDTSAAEIGIPEAVAREIRDMATELNHLHRYLTDRTDQQN